MTTMTAPQADAVWAAIDDQRARTADLLQQLTEEQWRRQSLCEGWTVRHVAAHLTLQQHRIRDIAAFVARNPRILRSVTLNATIHDTALIQSSLPTDEHGPPHQGRDRLAAAQRLRDAVETLSDILVHSQDIAMPLGRSSSCRRPRASSPRPAGGTPGAPGSPRCSVAAARWVPPHGHGRRLGAGGGPRGGRADRRAAAPAHRTRGALGHLTGEGADALRAAPSRSR